MMQYASLMVYVRVSETKTPRLTKSTGRFAGGLTGGPAIVPVEVPANLVYLNGSNRRMNSGPECCVMLSYIMG